MAGTSGVAFPVPRKSASMGKATVLVNSSEKKKSFITSLMGIKAKKISNQRIMRIMRWKRFISLAWRWRSEVGKTLVQKVESLPKETW